MEPKDKGTKSDKEDKFNIRTLQHRFLNRALKFTETIIVWVALLYILNWVVSIVLIAFAIKETMNFMYLDTLITQTSETFRDVVGVAIIKFGIENIFKYNDFGGKIPSKPVETNDEDYITNLENDSNDNFKGGVG